MLKSHNKKVINNDVKELKSCNCRVKSECPLNGQCQVTDVIYKCTVLSPEKPFQEAIMLINSYCEIIKQSIDCNSLTGKQQWIGSM